VSTSSIGVWGVWLVCVGAASGGVGVGVGECAGGWVGVLGVGVCARLVRVCCEWVGGWAKGVSGAGVSRCAVRGWVGGLVGVRG